jgi:hypothetical protein
MRERALVVIALLAILPRNLTADDQPLKPVRFTVVDVLTKKPVTEFSYTLHVTAPGEVDQKRERQKVKPVRVASPSGTFSVNVPESCKIHLALDSPDAILGSKRRGPTEFMVFSADKERKFLVNLEIGTTVAGIVRNAKTKRPIPGAKVVAGVALRGYVPNSEYATTADEKGRFEVHRVNQRGCIIAFHRDHQTFSAEAGEPLPARDVIVELDPVEKVTIQGVVRDDENRPVSGVAIAAKDQVTSSAADGRFSLAVNPPQYESDVLEFKKSGYVDQKMGQRAAVGKVLSVVLVPLFNVQGRVTTSDGAPVESFTVAVGPRLDDGPGHDFVMHEVRGTDGRFLASLKFDGRNRVVVKAEGYAVWEGAVAVSRKPAPLEIQLKRGVTVSGHVERPLASLSPLRASLVANPKEKSEVRYSDEGRSLSTLQAELNHHDAFRIDHVPPDDYLLRIEGRDITPVYRLIHVDDHDVDVGTLSAIGTGRIVGTVHRVGGLEEAAWPFAHLIATWEPSPGPIENEPEHERHFVAAEDGRFVMENAPAGRLSLVVLFPMVYDILPSADWVVQVVPGKTTEVRAFGRTKESQLAASITVGDGSREHFEIGSADRNPDRTLLARFRPDLPPPFTLDVASNLNDTSCFSSWRNPGNRNDWNRVVLKDVNPGRYHVRLLAGNRFDRPAGSILFEADLQPGAGPVPVALDAAAIVGKVLGGDSGSVIAIEQNSNRKPRRADFSGDGGFSIPFVRNGAYLLVAHDPSTGWYIGPQIQVHNQIAESPPMKLVPGGEIRGKIVPRTPCPIPDAVVAVDRSGVEIRDEMFDRSGLMRFRIPQLWPADWTVQLMQKDEILTSARVKISGTETVTADLVFDSGRQR